MDFVWHILLPIICCIFSAALGFFIAVFLGAKWHIYKIRPRGAIKMVYDPDCPDHPAMGLMLEGMDYISSHKVITLAIQKIGFPDQKNA